MLTFLFLKSWWREITIAVLSLALYFSWSAGASSHDEVTELTKIITQYRQKLSETKTVITTVTTKPDGTRVEKTEITEKKTKDTTKNTDKVHVIETKDKLSRYRIAVFKHITRSGYSGEVGARLGTLPFDAAILLDTDSISNVHAAIGLGYSW